MTVPPNLPSASWSLIEYDAAFVTTIPDNKNSKGYVSSAIISGQLFLRSFVRLEEGQRNNMVRSNVLAIDRLVYPSYDLQSIVEFAHEYGAILLQVW